VWMYQTLRDHNSARSRHVQEGGPMTKTILVLKVTAEKDTTGQTQVPAPGSCIVGLEEVPASRGMPEWTPDLIRQADALAKSVLYREGTIVQVMDQTTEVSTGFPTTSVEKVPTGWRTYRAIHPHDREGWSTI
jgi:hypothetical protein